ncbi:MAG TPA: hypothetical protein DCQ31_02295 [Bacteroidales bacterium]|nr:hypothetical protein [Bacteroidales bacterium]
MQQKLKLALMLSILTVIYNLAEGLISVYFGVSDEALALFGFGTDSFVEVISGIGIWHMVLRMQKSPVDQFDAFEVKALRITGFSFYVLTAGLIIGAAISVITNKVPETTMPGIIVSSISILTMYFLMQQKLKVGKALNSEAIIADANCTKTCFYLSIILLISSGLYYFTGFIYADLLGSLGIAWFAFSEGKEAFEKAKTKKTACACCAH